MSNSKINVEAVAKLANLPLTKAEQKAVAGQLEETLVTVSKLSELDTTGVKPVAHASEVENVWREDIIDSERQFSQEEALANAQRTYQGYFVVEAVI